MSYQNLYENSTAVKPVFNIQDKWSAALERIRATYGDIASYTRKDKNLTKFGFNAFVVDTAWTTLAQFASNTQRNFADVTGNGIAWVVSDDATNTQEISYEGHTIDGNGNLTFVGGLTVTLNGTDPVALPTNLHIATRGGNNNGTPLADGSKVYFMTTNDVTAGVPNVATDVQLIVDAEYFDQSEKLETATSSTDYFVVEQLLFSINRKNAGVADALLLVQEQGKVFKPKLAPISVSTTGSSTVSVRLDELIIVPPNSRIKCVARSASGTLRVSGFISGRLATTAF